MRALSQHRAGAPALGVTSTTRARSSIEPERARRLAGVTSPKRRRACLDAEAALALADGRASGRSWDELDAHLDACPACFRLAAHALHALHPELVAAGAERGPASSLRPGTVLAGRFTVEACVGRGGMGEVYRAHDAKRRSTVAIKIVVATACDDPRAQQQLLGEARAMRDIAHPNLCRVLGAHVHERADEPPLPFLSLEYLPGATLRTWLRRAPLDLGFATCVARQIAHGLKALHGHGVLHLDVKPDNVMVHTGSGGAPHATLLDFGLARPFGLRGTASRSSPALAGSAGYMAPEQLRGGTLGIPTDVFAFGVTLFELLTRRSPSAPAPSMPASAVEWARDAPSTYVPGLPESFDVIVERCSKCSPAERYTSFDALLAELDRVAA